VHLHTRSNGYNVNTKIKFDRTYSRHVGIVLELGADDSKHRHVEISACVAGVLCVHFVYTHCPASGGNNSGNNCMLHKHKSCATQKRWKLYITLINIDDKG